MKKNIGIVDRLVRLSLSAVIGVGILYTDSIIVQGLLVILSLFVLFEALVGWCALYALIGRNTCPVNLENKRIRTHGNRHSSVSENDTIKTQKN